MVMDEYAMEAPIMENLGIKTIENIKFVKSARPDDNKNILVFRTLFIPEASITDPTNKDVAIIIIMMGMYAIV